MENIERLVSTIFDKNWLDVGVLIAIGVFFLIGLSSGIIFSSFRLLSMFIALIMSLAFYDRLAGFIYGTYAETVIDAFIYDNFLSNPEVSAAQFEVNIDNALIGIVDMLRLPNGVAEAIFTRPASLASISRTNIFNDIDIIGHFSAQCTHAVIALFCLVVVYVIIRVIIAIVKIFLDEIAALKMFRLFNYIAGPVFGLIEGIAVVYIALAVIMVVNIVIQLEPLHDLIESARFSKGMYENNLFLNFVLPRMKL
ncbi:MAG: CvpA family protein [Oscillospiraceae bacterium]|nr:CvpA family protein [Oscillospiraceae bacterium]